MPAPWPWPNISLNKTGTASGMITDVKGSGLSYTVTVRNITGDGSLGISIAAGTASDLAGNLAPAAGPSTTFTVDNTAARDLDRLAFGGLYGGRTGYVHGDLCRRELQFQQPDGGEHQPDCRRDGRRDDHVRQGFGLELHGHRWNITGDGSLGILIAAGTASDLAGNLTPAQSSGTFTVDNTGPTVVTSASANPNPITTRRPVFRYEAIRHGRVEA